jgi:energy-coupling factor transporter ATP-binding protein EcfA2
MAITPLETAVESLKPRLLQLYETRQTPIVLIDGRAGAGKSTLAKLISDSLFREQEQAPRIVHMDDLYEGWEGLRQGSQYLNSHILRPLVQNGKAEWQQWYWARNRRGGRDPGNGWREFQGPNLLIVEGCGSISRESAELADLSVWVESPRPTRKQRFLARDSGAFADYWDLWSSQEESFYAEERSKDLAKLQIEN